MQLNIPDDIGTEHDTYYHLARSKSVVDALLPDHYKTLSEAGKRRQRKRRHKERVIGEWGNQITVIGHSPGLFTNSHSRPTVATEQDDQASAGPETPVDTISNPEQTWDLENSPGVHEILYALGISTGSTASPERLRTRDAVITTAPPPEYYKLLSEPGKRRNRRSRRKVAASLESNQSAESAYHVGRPAALPKTRQDSLDYCRHRSRRCWTLFNCDHLERVCNPYPQLSGDFVDFDPDTCGSSCIVPMCALGTDWGRRSFDTRRANFFRSRVKEKIDEELREVHRPGHHWCYEKFRVSLAPSGADESANRDYCRFELETENASSEQWWERIDRQMLGRASSSLGHRSAALYFSMV